MYPNEYGSNAITWTRQTGVQTVLCACLCMGVGLGVGAGLNYVGKCLTSVCAAPASGPGSGASCGGGHITASLDPWPLLDSSLRECCLPTLSPDPECGPARPERTGLRLCEE